MSQTRQDVLFDPRGVGSAELTTLAYDYPSRLRLPRHYHDRAQLIYACTGVMTVSTDQGLWVVPPLRAVWVPAYAPHDILMSGDVSMRTLYFAEGLAPAMPDACCAVEVSPLLRELILHACTSDSLRRTDPKQRRLIDIIVDQLQDMQVLPLRLPTPADARARRVADVYLADPGDARTLDEACRACGASKRTVERIFARDTGMTFGRWRQQLRLIHALQLLASGETVTHAALDAGYATPSAFTSMFKKALGCSPSHYFQGRDL